MKRCEFLGPMGAGKSTLYNKVSETLTKRSSTAITANELKKQIRLKNTDSIVHYLTLQVLTLLPSLEVKLIQNQITHFGWQALKERPEKWDDYLDYVLNEYVFCKDNLHQSLWRMSCFIREITDLALFKSNCENEFVIQDESLLQMGIGFSLSCQSSDLFIQRYFEIVPSPEIVIYVTADPKLLKKRLSNRSVKVVSHIDYIEQAIKLTQIAANILQRRGVNVLELNGANDLKSNKYKSLQAISELNIKN